MFTRLQNLGDRIIGRLVPSVTAEAGLQDYTQTCACLRGWYWERACVAGGGCGRCYSTTKGC